MPLDAVSLALHSIWFVMASTDVTSTQHAPLNASLPLHFYCLKGTTLLNDRCLVALQSPIFNVADNLRVLLYACSPSIVHIIDSMLIPNYISEVLEPNSRA